MYPMMGRLRPCAPSAGSEHPWTPLGDQVEAMTRFYNQPVLLIEFDERRPFSVGSARGMVACEAWYPTRRGSPRGLVSHAAWYPTRHGSPRGSSTSAVICARRRASRTHARTQARTHHLECAPRARTHHLECAPCARTASFGDAIHGGLGPASRHWSLPVSRACAMTPQHAVTNGAPAAPQTVGRGADALPAR
jgi:hypothetical protein